MAETPEEKEKRETIEFLDEKIRDVIEIKAIAKARFTDYHSGRKPDVPTSVKHHYAFQTATFENFELIFEGLKAIILNLYEISKETETSTLSQRLATLQREFDEHKPMLEALRERVDQTKRYFKDNK